MSAVKNALIVGGGVGGMSAAIALRRIDVAAPGLNDIYEQRTAHGIGAGHTG